MSKPTRPQPPRASAHKTANRPPIQQKRATPVAPPAYHPHPTLRVLQPKSAAPQGRKTPNAPPVYRPQPAPKCLQPKAATLPKTPGRTGVAPSPPPAYRPQPTPKVLQKKAACAQQSRAGCSESKLVASPARLPQPGPEILQAKVADRGQSVFVGRHAPAHPTPSTQSAPKARQTRSPVHASANAVKQEVRGHTVQRFSVAGAASRAANVIQRVTTMHMSADVLAAQQAIQGFQVGLSDLSVVGGILDAWDQDPAATTKHKYIIKRIKKTSHPIIAASNANGIQAVATYEEGSGNENRFFVYDIVSNPNRQPGGARAILHWLAQQAQNKGVSWGVTLQAADDQAAAAFEHMGFAAQSSCVIV